MLTNIQNAMTITPNILGGSDNFVSKHILKGFARGFPSALPFS